MRGGKRQGAGRPSQGITKKVSLTLTKDQWELLAQITKIEGSMSGALRLLIEREQQEQANLR